MRLGCFIFVNLGFVIAMFTIKRRMRDYKREITRTAQTAVEKEGGLKGRSGKVVLIAVAM